MDVEEARRKLRTYSIKDIEFYEPHVTEKLIERGGKREDIITNVLNPVSLINVIEKTGKYGDTIHCLIFELGDNKTMRIPVIFNFENRKILYILTYILRYRKC